MSSPTPLAEGTLSTTPFAHVVLSIHRKQLSGTLAVWPDDSRAGQDRILFDAGVPRAARLLEPAETLERGLLPLFRRVDSPYAFYESDLVGTGADVLVGECPVPALLAAGLRGGGRDDVIDQVLATFGASPVRIAARFETEPFALLPKETAFLDVLRAAPASIADLVATSGDAKVARRVLYLLAITGGLEQPRATRADFDSLPGLDDLEPAHAPSTPIPSRPAPPEAGARATSSNPPRVSMPRADRKKARAFAPPEPPPPPPPELSPELAARWNDLVDRIVVADEQSHFDLFGIAESAGHEEARSAYFELAKKVHPDRLPPELAPLRPYVERLFQQITEAKETLDDDEKRIAYLRNVRSGGGTPASDRKLMAILAASHELEKAAVLTNLGKWSEVLDALEDAKVFDASQSDIYALEAWALFNLMGQHPNATPDTILALTERVLAEAKDGYHERALYTRGLVLKRVGKEDAAVDLFRKIVAKNPRNLDAAREVRLYEMRKRNAGKPATESGSKLPEGGSFLSKLFGKKE